MNPKSFGGRVLVVEPGLFESCVVVGSAMVAVGDNTGVVIMDGGNEIRGE